MGRNRRCTGFPRMLGFSRAVGLVVLAVTLVVPVGSRAEDRFSQRQDRNKKNIEQGIKDGSLTRAEADYLIHRFGRVEEQRDRMKSRRNKLPSWEKRKLDRLQNIQARHIKRLTNNKYRAKPRSGD